MTILRGTVLMDENSNPVGGLRVQVDLAQVEALPVTFQCYSSPYGKFELPLGSSPLSFPLKIQIFGGQDAVVVCERLCDSTAEPMEIRLSSSELRNAEIAPTLDWAISRLQFENASIAVPVNGLVVVIGPNGGGKTRTLRELAQLNRRLDGMPASTIVAVEERHAAQWEILSWVSQHHRIVVRDNREFAQTRDAEIELPNTTQELKRLLVAFHSIDSRLSDVRFQELNSIAARPNSLIEHALRDPRKFADVSAKVKELFNVTLVPDIGPLVGLRIAPADFIVPPNWFESEFRYKAQQFPKLEEVGHGIGSFVATLLTLTFSPEKLLLIDEPEAFLHPPLAKALGKIIEKASRGRQIVVATHSADLLVGIMSVKSQQASALTIVRLVRDGRDARANAIDAKAADELRQQPMSESTELFSAMFHDGVVLCEGDSDRRFYRGLVPHADYMFINCNGKGNFAKFAQQFRKVGLPIVAVFDLDIFRNEGEISKLVEAVVRDESDRQGFARLYLAARELRERLTDTEVMDAEEVLSRISDAVASASMSSANEIVVRIKELTKEASSSALLAKNGVETLSNEGQRAAEELIDFLKLHGIFVVRRGSLESWHPLKVRKSRWLSEVTPLLGDAAQLLEARAFMNEIDVYLRNKLNVDLDSSQMVDAGLGS